MPLTLPRTLRRKDLVSADVLMEMFQAIVDKFSANIVDGDISPLAAINGTKLATASDSVRIPTDAIASQAVTAAKLRDLAITAQQIKDLTITSAKLAAAMKLGIDHLGVATESLAFSFVTAGIIPTASQVLTALVFNPAIHTLLSVYIVSAGSTTPTSVVRLTASGNQFRATSVTPLPGAVSGNVILVYVPLASA